MNANSHFGTFEVFASYVYNLVDLCRSLFEQVKLVLTFVLVFLDKNQSGAFGIVLS